LFNFINHLHFFPVSGYVGRDPVDCFARGPNMLLRRPGSNVYVFQSHDGLTYMCFNFTMV